VVILRPGRSFLRHCLLLPYVKRVASPRPFPADDTARFARNHVGRRVGSVFNTVDGYDGARARAREPSNLLIASSGRSETVGGKRGAARRGAARRGLMGASRASAVRFRAEPRSSSISRASPARRGSRGGLRVPRASLTQLDQGVKNEIGKHGTRGSLLCRARGALPSRVTSARRRERERTLLSRLQFHARFRKTAGRGGGKEGVRGNGRTIVTNHCTFGRRASTLFVNFRRVQVVSPITRSMGEVADLSGRGAR